MSFVYKTVFMQSIEICIVPFFISMRRVKMQSANGEGAKVPGFLLYWTRPLKLFEALNKGQKRISWLKKYLKRFMKFPVRRWGIGVYCHELATMLSPFLNWSPSFTHACNTATIVDEFENASSLAQDEKVEQRKIRSIQTVVIPLHYWSNGMARNGIGSIGIHVDLYCHWKQ